MFSKEDFQTYINYCNLNVVKYSKIYHNLNFSYFSQSNFTRPICINIGNNKSCCISLEQCRPNHICLIIILVYEKSQKSTTKSMQDIYETYFYFKIPVVRYEWVIII